MLDNHQFRKEQEKINDNEIRLVNKGIGLGLFVSSTALVCSFLFLYLNFINLREYLFSLGITYTGLAIFGIVLFLKNYNQKD